MVLNSSDFTIAAIPTDEVEACRRVARRGGYHILLGAGSSFGSKRRNGEPIPNGDQLREMLSGTGSTETLFRVYDRAKTRDPDGLWSRLREIFFGTTPSPWLCNLAALPWAKVWTLNLDDSFENGFRRAFPGSTRGDLSTINWSDPFRETAALDVVHLHGHVDSPVALPIVFSLAEYRNALLEQRAWGLMFQDMFSESPFVVLGARLFGEPDLEPLLSIKRAPLAPPRLYVNPTISDDDAADLMRWGIRPVRCTGEEFAEWWAQVLEPEPRVSPPTKRHASRRFGRSFRDPAESGPGPKKHDFIAGDEPTWEDVRGGRHAEWPWLSRLTDRICEYGRKPNFDAATVLLLGRRFYGGSTNLLHIADKISQVGVRPWFFAGDGRPDVASVLDWAADNGPIGLFWDGTLEYANEISKIVEEARLDSLPILNVCWDMRDREAALLGRMPLAHQGLTDSRPLYVRPLNRQDAATLTIHLGRLGRLGVLEQLDFARCRAHFEGISVFAGLAEVERGAGFQARLEVVTRSLAPTQKEALFLLAMASSVGRDVPMSVLTVSLRTSSATIFAWLENDAFSALVEYDGHFIRSRQRTLALDGFVSLHGAEECSRLLMGWMDQLAALANSQSQIQRNRAFLLVRELMSYRELSRVLPGVDLNRFYEALRPRYAWSARFWEQWAIQCRHSGRIDSAESYAERAVTIQDDAFTQTTLLTTLLVKAQHLGLRGDPAWVQYYDRSWSALERALEVDYNNLVGRMAFLGWTQKLLSSFEKKPDLKPWSGLGEHLHRIEDDWSDVYAWARVSAGKGTDTAGQLEKMSAMFGPTLSHLRTLLER